MIEKYFIALQKMIIRDIENWNLFTEKFGAEYLLHGAVIKQFNLNGDELFVTGNTLYEMNDGKVYDIVFKFSQLIRFEYHTEIGNVYMYGIDVKRDKFYKHLIHFTFEDVDLTIECFKVELLSIDESEPFQRGMIMLDDANQTGESSEVLWRS